MFKITVFVGAILFFITSFSFAADEITITTYYPSPYGVYNNLRLFPTVQPNCNSANDEGLMYYNSTNHTFQVCVYNTTVIPAVYEWQAFGGVQAGHWTQTGSDLYPNDPGWNVGIGTASPAAKLDVAGDIYVNTNGILFTDPQNSNATVELRASDASYPDEGIAVRTLTNPASGEPIFRVISSGGSERLRVEHGGALKTSNYLEVDGAGDSYIQGDVGIGTTSPGYKLEVVGAAGIGADAYYYRCDISLKENINPLKNALEKVTQMNGVSFNWKESGEGSIGLIAQEVEEIFPEVVATRNNTKSIDYAKLIAPLIEAVKEQQVQIEQLKAKIDQLGIRN